MIRYFGKPELKVNAFKSVENKFESFSVSSSIPSKEVN
jgi:hypothetical protein